MVGPAMYKQRPAYPALVGACFVLIIGVLIMCGMKPAVDAGEMDQSMVLLAAFMTLCVTSILVVAAFARYQFTHLWRHKDPAFSKKRKLRKEEKRIDA